MPRVLIGSIAETAREHLAGRLVGEGNGQNAVRTPRFPVWMSQAIRVVRTRVLARARAGEDQRRLVGRVTAASCSGLRFSSR